jgi:hypothetical protein
MAHTNTWNAANEASPADSDNVSEGAGKIRTLKLDIRERIAKDHYMAIAGTDADHGEHSKITLQAPLGADPSNVADKGFLYTKDVSAKVELFWEDEDGNVLQLTNQGQSDIPSGEIIVFDKDTVVIGYTLKTDKDDMLLFITKGSVAGGETGGGDHSTGSWTLSGISTQNESAHTHSHNHKWYENNATNVIDRSWTSAGAARDIQNGSGLKTNAVYKALVLPDPTGTQPMGDMWTDNDGTGGSAHNHTMTLGSSWRPAARCFTRQERN